MHYYMEIEAFLSILLNHSLQNNVSKHIYNMQEVLTY